MASGAEHAMLNPIGFNKVVCLTNSDTIVGVPFRIQGSMRDLVAETPAEVQGEPDLAEVQLESITLEPGALDTHYLKFDGGTRDGRWYDITANSATSVTIDLNGDTLDGVGEGDAFVITEYWTLDTLFPPDQATNGWEEHPENAGEWIPNGHAIMASEGSLAFQRKTLLMLTDGFGEGINRSATKLLYILDNQWRRIGSAAEDFGNTVLYPDAAFTIRHPSTVSHPTIFRSWGEVDTSSQVVPLHTSDLGQRDAFVALPRPVDLTLSDLNLWESGAFMESAGSLAFQRRDLLFMYDNGLQSINKSADRIFYHDGSSWREVGEGEANMDDAELSAGSGFIIRKYEVEGGETFLWNNTTSY